jgi:protein gp37
VGERTSIGWCHHTFNPWWGCHKVDPCCDRCYAESGAKRYGWDIWGKDAPRRFFDDDHFKQPLKWNKEAEAAGERRRVFCASYADVCEDRRDLDVWREKLWDLIRATPWLDWLLLTKRPQHLKKLVPPDILKRCWIGVTAGTQKGWDTRVPYLLEIDCAVRFVSVEPMLEPVKMAEEQGRSIDWVIIGGESGGRFKVRPFLVNAARDLVHECSKYSIATFFKQMGSRTLDAHDVGLDGTTEPWPVGTNRVQAAGSELVQIRLKHPKGEDMSQWPEDLRIQEFPRARAA